MLHDQRLMSDVIMKMADDHFRKLASLSIRTGGAVELGKVAAARFDLPTDDEYLQKMAMAQLGADHLEKLAQAIINEEVAWEELSDLEKTALGRAGMLGRVGGALKRGWTRMTRGRTPSLGKNLQGSATPSVPRTRSFGGGTKTPTGRPGPYGGPGASGGRVPPQQAGAQMRSKFQALNQGQTPLRGNAAVQKASRAAGGTRGARKPLLKFRHKALIGGGLAGTGALYIGGKGLDTANTFLHQRQGPYQYGMGAPTPFMQSQGM